MWQIEGLQWAELDRSAIESGRPTVFCQKFLPIDLNGR